MSTTRGCYYLHSRGVNFLHVAALRLARYRYQPAGVCASAGYSFFFGAFGQPSGGRFFFNASLIAFSQGLSILTCSGLGPVFRRSFVELGLSWDSVACTVSIIMSAASIFPCTWRMLSSCTTTGFWKMVNGRLPLSKPVTVSG